MSVLTGVIPVMTLTVPNIYGSFSSDSIKCDRFAYLVWLQLLSNPLIPALPPPSTPPTAASSLGRSTGLLQGWKLARQSVPRRSRKWLYYRQ